MKTTASLAITGIYADADPTITVIAVQGPDSVAIPHLSQGIFSAMKPPRRGSLAERLAQIFAEEDLDWYTLPREDRRLLADCLRRFVAMERDAGA